MRIDGLRSLHRRPNPDANTSSMTTWFIGGITSVIGLAFVLILLTINKGFDWSDEGFVYTLLTNNRVSNGDVWGFQHLLHPLFGLLGENIVVFRILRLVGYVALSLLLWRIAKLIVSAVGMSLKRSSWAVVILVAQVGTLAAWSYPPRYLGYNELASWLSQAGGAFLLLLLITSRTSGLPRQRFSPVPLWTVVGALVAVAFIAKFTAALLLLGLAALVLLFLPGPRAKLLSALSLTFGTVVTTGLLFVSGVPIAAYTANVFDVLLDPAASAESGYSIPSLAAVYLQSASVTVAAVAVPAILITVGLLASRGWRSAQALVQSHVVVAVQNVALALVGLLGLLMLLPSAVSNWDALGIANALLFCIAIIGFALLARFTSSPLHTNSGITVAVAIGVFALTPLISGLGTTNAIFGQTVFSATLWAVAAATVLCLLAEQAEASSFLARAIPQIILVFIALSATLAVAGDVFVHPYRTTPYFKQSTAVSEGPLAGISLSPQEAAVATWLHEASSRHAAAGEPAISMVSPGTLLAFNSSPWTNAWPGPDLSTSIARSCDLDYPDRLLIVRSGNDKVGAVVYEKVVAGLAECGITFPQDFSMIDERVDDDPASNISIWRLSADAGASR
jgi:hypothetical protein